MILTLANVAVPIFFPHPLVALLALLPVVGTEYAVLCRRVGVGPRRVFAANLVSALLGVPVAIFCLFILGAGFDVYLSLHNISLTSVLLVALGVVLPCFALSVLVEGSYLRRHVSVGNSRAFWYAIIKAHYYSYMVLIFLDCLWLSAKLW